MAKKEYKEKDLFIPVRDWLCERGFDVRAEVRSCDIVGLRGEELVVVELKTAFNLDLLLQAVKRQRIADTVYVAIPHTGVKYNARMRDILRMVRRVEMGMLTVNMNKRPPTVRELVEPKPYLDKRATRYSRHERQAVLAEISGRAVELNTGGSTREPIYTAYKLRALQVAEYLNAHGPARAPQIAEATGVVDAYRIVYVNPMGWFAREGEEKGVYGITQVGIAAIHTYHNRLMPTQEAQQWETDDADY